MATSTHDKNEKGLAGKGPIATLFSGPARTRIIEAFVANKSRELNVSDVARESDTARSTVYRHLEDLEELGLIIKTGAANERYALNRDSDIADLLRKLEGVTLQRLLKIESDEN